MEKLIEAINEVYQDIEVKIKDTKVYLRKPEWKNWIDFELDLNDDNMTILDEIRDLFCFKYIPNKGCLYEDYAEFAVTLSNTFFTMHFWGTELTDEDIASGKIYYEVAPISDEFEKILLMHHSFIVAGPEDFVTTLKIYNINKVMDKKYSDEGFVEVAIEIAKCIMFELSTKYDLPLGFFEIPESDDHENDPFYEAAETLKKVRNPELKAKYDKDLVDYYYRALQMAESEFKYLAFYQVMECVFEEVYLEETVQDVKEIINSNWFSNYDHEHISTVIKLIEQYSKNKNDREKLKLLLEKYFKGNIHDEAYYLANKDIIELLLTMKLITKQVDFKDLQKIANIIYDFRCNCTHSDRRFPFRTTFSNNSIEMNNYT